MSSSNQIERVFRLLKETKHALELLAKNFDNNNLNGLGQSAEEKCQKLNGINKLIEEIKGFDIPQLIEREKKVSSSQQKVSSSDYHPPKFSSKNWSKLHIDEDLLVGQMMYNLKVSYDILPIKLRICSLFLSVFPEKAIIKKKSLIYWWIGEGIITKTSTMTAEEAGEEAFMKLIEKGLINPFHKTLKNPLIHGCTVNAWIRRMLISMAKEANFFAFDKDGKLTGRSTIKPAGALSSIYNINKSYLKINEASVSKAERLKVVQLGRWDNNPHRHIEVEDTKFLKKLGRQKQLKFVSLRGMSSATTIPSSIVECQNLEILDLKACHNLEKLPSDIGSLRKLTHFIVSECYLLESLPKGLDDISSLEVLKGFVIGDHWRKNPYEIRSLKRMEKLRKLSIYAGKGNTSDEVWGHLKMENLRGLTITWKLSSNPIPPFYLPALEKCELRCFPENQLPFWILPYYSPHLKRLYIRGGNLKELPLEYVWGQWSSVEILRLNFLPYFRFERTFDIHNWFPNLVYFERIKCYQISDGIFDQDIVWRIEDGWETLVQKIRN